MSRRYLKIILIIGFIFLLNLFLIIPQSNAAFDLGTVFSQADSFISQGESGTNVDSGEISAIFIPIAQVLVRVGTIVLAIVTAIMAIKYMTANPNDKAKLKTQLVGLVVATLVIAGAQVIWAAVYNFLNNIL